MRLEGLDQLTDQYSVVVEALQELERRVATVHVEPNDEASVRAAIASIDDEIDKLLLPYRANSIVEAIAGQFKERAAENIRLRASQLGRT